jgi:hypothetical protein
MPREPRQRHRIPRPAPAVRQSHLVHLGYGHNNCTTGFVGLFTEAQAQKRPPKQQLANQQHRALRDNAGLVVSIRPAWAGKTKLNVVQVGEVRLQHPVYVPPTHILPRYCQKVGIEDADPS